MASTRFAPSQWEMSLQSNAISHWLGANLESALQNKNQVAGMEYPSPIFLQLGGHLPDHSHMSPATKLFNLTELTEYSQVIWVKIQHSGTYWVCTYTKDGEAFSITDNPAWFCLPWLGGPFSQRVLLSWPLDKCHRLSKWTSAINCIRHYYPCSA